MASRTFLTLVFFASTVSMILSFPEVRPFHFLSSPALASLPNNINYAKCMHLNVCFDFTKIQLAVQPQPESQPQPEKPMEQPAEPNVLVADNVPQYNPMPRTFGSRK